MAITWILVANASLARLYANLGPKQGLKLIKELVHPESRMKNADLASDRAGQMQAAGSGHGAREQATPPKQNAARTFAQMLVELSKVPTHDLDGCADRLGRNFRGFSILKNLKHCSQTRSVLGSLRCEILH